MFRKLLITVLFMHCLFFNNVYALLSDEIVIEDNRCDINSFEYSEANQEKASLVFQMKVKESVDGVVQGINFDLLNNTNRSVIIKTRPLILESILIGIVINGGQGISKKHKRYDSGSRKTLKHDESKIQPGNKKSWFINIKDILKTDKLLKNELSKGSKGFLLVAFHFNFVVDAEECSKEFKKQSIVLNVKNMFFTLDSSGWTGYLSRP